MSATLKDVLKPKTVKNGSSRNPQYYGNEKSLLIVEGTIDVEPKVRLYFAKSPHTPQKVLTTMLKNEGEKHILRAVLKNPNTSLKAIAKFVYDSTDERVGWFSTDQDLIDHFTTLKNK